jgi:hypothetical protein
MDVVVWVLMVVSPLGSGAMVQARRMAFRVVPIEGYVDVGCGGVFQPIAEEFNGDIPKNLSAGGARDGDRIAAKAQFREVYGVLAEDVIAHPHIGETPPCERVRCGWWSGSHLASRFCVCTSALKRGMYMPNATWRRRG